jgi:hypothetical protein
MFLLVTTMVPESVVIFCGNQALQRAATVAFTEPMNLELRRLLRALDVMVLVGGWWLVVTGTLLGKMVHVGKG